MNKELQNKFRKKLLEEKQELQNTLANMEEGALDIPLQDSISELSMYDNHPADLGSETFERSKDMALREQTELLIRKIDGALAALKNGTYGICDTCGVEIPMERLEAMPSTTMCRKCKETEEELPDRHRRSACMTRRRFGNARACRHDSGTRRRIGGKLRRRPVPPPEEPRHWSRCVGRPLLRLPHRYRRSRGSAGCTAGARPPFLPPSRRQRRMCRSAHSHTPPL